ncbi:MAG: DMT family transporter [Candidatus Moduliflexus flocculans]|nr:DMT family transporter [Candidatus Moduliflexus flocculans]
MGMQIGDNFHGVMISQPGGKVNARGVVSACKTAELHLLVWVLHTVPGQSISSEVTIMTGWFPFALAALLLMGMQRFFYKVAAERSCDTAVTTLSFMATVTVISAVVFFLRDASLPDVSFLLLVGLANSLAFLLATVTHIEALKKLPARIAYPLIRLDAVLVVVISFFFFHEQVSGRQQIGIALALAAVLLIARERAGSGDSVRRSATGFLFVAAAILAGAAAAISSRFAALGTDKIAFMAVSYGLSTLFVAGFGERGRRQEKAAPGSRESLRIGCLMGILNVVGYYAYLEALSRGPFPW